MIGPSQSPTRDRDDLLDQRETTRAYTASTLGNDATANGRSPGGDDDGGQRGKWHLFGPRSAPQAAAPPVQAVNGHVPDVPADASATPD